MYFLATQQLAYAILLVAMVLLMSLSALLRGCKLQTQVVLSL
jgi:hypothetical protein